MENKTRKPRVRKPILIHIVGLLWFDRVNGNTYHATRTTLTYRDQTTTQHTTPFSYGYGDQYIYSALHNLVEKKLLPGIKIYPKGHPNAGRPEQLWQYCSREKISKVCTKHENCKKRELMNI